MKYTITLIAIFITIHQSCSSQVTYDNKPVTKRDTVFENAFSQIDSNLFYFPTKMFLDSSDLPGMRNFRVNWYSKQLIALKDPIIFSDNSTKEIYRFTWLRSFHNPIAIRLERLDNDYKLYWKLCSGAGGYAPGKLIIDKQKTIDQNTWDVFKMLLDQINFWRLNTTEEVMGTDGAEWIIEGKKSQQYQVVDRWTPNHDSRYYKCCDYLIRLTDFVIADKDKY
jgi:hypothetical protein